MKTKTLGTMISTLRKEQGMTQLELAERMGVTDKAVSKWERDLSCPDINSLPKLAEIFDVSVDDLMQVKIEAEEQGKSEEVAKTVNTVLKAIGLAMGVAVAALSLLNQLEAESAIGMLGIGVACLAISAFQNKAE